MIKAYSTQLAFLGLKMPGLSGLEYCRVIKNNPALVRTSVAMIIAAGNPEQVQDCRDAGCDEILFKPINHDEFLAIVRRCLALDIRDDKRLKAQIRVYYGSAPQKLLLEFSVDLSAGGLMSKRISPLRSMRA
jgi:DNA-binding response OmpR family regulator